MSAEVKAHIATELALLESLIPFPDSPFLYGSDISCDTDLDPTLAEVNPDSTLGLAQSLFRRLDCPRGENSDDANYGIGVVQLVNTGVIKSDLEQLAGQINVELLKDDRVDSLVVRVADIGDGTGRNLRITNQVTPVDRRLGPFRLTLNASSAALLLEEINSER